MAYTKKLTTRLRTPKASPNVNTQIIKAALWLTLVISPERKLLFPLSKALKIAVKTNKTKENAYIRILCVKELATVPLYDGAITLVTKGANTNIKVEIATETRMKIFITFETKFFSFSVSFTEI